MRSLRNNRDFAVGLTVTLIGAVIYFVVLPSQLETAAEEGGVTLALFPKLASGVITFLGLLMTIGSLVGAAAAQRKRAPRLTRMQKIQVTAAVVIMGLYLVAMDLVGFVISTPLFVFGFMLFLGARKMWLMALMAVLLTAATYFAFDSFVGVPLPSGTLFE